MNLDDDLETQQFLEALFAFIEAKTKQFLAELQELRFANDGAFNGHEAWAPNVRPDIVAAKGGKPPLQDSGRLKEQLTNPNNWELNPTWDGRSLRLNVPDMEDFTDPTYDALENEDGGTYTGRLTGKQITFKSKPARKFKDISEQDVQWVADKLEQAIRQEFGS
jgi:hypothetical protein